MSASVPGPSVANYPLVTYVDGIESTMAQAKAAAGDRNVHVLGAGRRPFDMLPSRIELDIVRVIDTPKATHIRYRVRR